MFGVMAVKRGAPALDPAAAPASAPALAPFMATAWIVMLMLMWPPSTHTDVLPPAPCHLYHTPHTIRSILFAP